MESIKALTPYTEAADKTMSAGRFDGLFATLAQQHDGIEGLLDSFFDFLHRKTDFYVVTKNPGLRKMGFLPGQAQQKAQLSVLCAFLKYPFKDLDGGLASADSSKASSKATRMKASQAVEVKSQGTPTTSAASTAVSTASVSTAAPKPMNTLKRAVQLTDSGKQLPMGNGGSTETYTWTQSLGDTTICIDLPDGTRSKDLDCKITSTHIRVALKNAEIPLLDGELPEKVRSDESLWSIESNQTLQISLEKIKKTWWASALKGDAEIDTNQVDSTRSIHEYDSATQMAIRKAMFDQQQQQLGQPTSDAKMIDAMMANARNAANSPI